MIIEIEDDTLREGLQAVSSRQFDVEEAKQYVRLSAACGVDHLILGFPSASEIEFERVVLLLRFIENEKIPVKPWILARIHQADAETCLRVRDCVPDSQFGVTAFRGVSEIRWKVESWSESDYEKDFISFSNFLKNCGLEISINLEDVTRASDLRIDWLLDRVESYEFHSIALCDTLGVYRPSEVDRLIKMVRSRISHEKKIVWHGHNDLGLALGNSLQAVDSGADIISGTFTGIGERSGNLSLEQILLHLNLFKNSCYDLVAAQECCTYLIDKLEIDITPWTPFIGAHSFSTQTGTHGAALIKSRAVDYGKDKQVFLPFDPTLLGREETIEIGPCSGTAQVREFLQKNCISLDEALLNDFLNKIKESSMVQTEESLLKILNKVRSPDAEL